MERNLPTGIQDFAKLRTDGQVYIDKTSYVWRLARAGNPLFLSRPRRFGKSLLLSTFKAYWEGRRDLFEGLDICALEDTQPDAWAPYAVFHLSFDGADYTIAGGLESKLDEQLCDWEERWGDAYRKRTLSGRLKKLIEIAHKQTGRGVVVLVDEYDKPLLDVMDDKALLEHNRQALKGFYGVLKDSDEHLKFLFVTGVTRFSKVSIFSEFNNLREISLVSDYANICGITEAEIEEYLTSEVETLAGELGIRTDECMDRLGGYYDGYCFHPRGPEARGAERVYNPFSLMTALQNKDIDAYWFESGTPTFLVKRIASGEVDLRRIAESEIFARKSSLKSFLVESPNPVPLLFQSGYLTISEYNPNYDEYRLGIPNGEVRRGLYDGLLCEYTGGASAKDGTGVADLRRHLEEGNADSVRDVLTALFAGIPYTTATDNQDPFENYVMAVIYVTFHLLGLDVFCETHVATGRVDVIVECARHVWLIEIKRDSTAAEALAQIEERGYAARYAADDRVLHKVGCSFDTKTRLLKDWLAV